MIEKYDTFALYKSNTPQKDDCDGIFFDATTAIAHYTVLQRKPFSCKALPKKTADPYYTTYQLS